MTIEVEFPRSIPEAEIEPIGSDESKEIKIIAMYCSEQSKTELIESDKPEIKIESTGSGNELVRNDESEIEPIGSNKSELGLIGSDEAEEIEIFDLYCYETFPETDLEYTYEKSDETAKDISNESAIYFNLESWIDLYADEESDKSPGEIKDKSDENINENSTIYSNLKYSSQTQPEAPTSSKEKLDEPRKNSNTKSISDFNLESWIELCIYERPDEPVKSSSESFMVNIDPEYNSKTQHEIPRDTREGLNESLRKTDEESDESAREIGHRHRKSVERRPKSPHYPRRYPTEHSITLSGKYTEKRNFKD